QPTARHNRPLEPRWDSKCEPACQSIHTLLPTVGGVHPLFRLLPEGQRPSPGASNRLLYDGRGAMEDDRGVAPARKHKPDLVLLGQSRAIAGSSRPRGGRRLLQGGPWSYDRPTESMAH